MGAVRLFALCVACILLWGCSDDYWWPTDRFASTAWKSTKESERYRYVKDLLNRKLLIGMNTDQVEDLLGKPYLALHLEPRIEGIGSHDPPHFYREDFIVKGTTESEELYLLAIKFTEDKVAYIAFVRRATY